MSKPTTRTRKFMCWAIVAGFVALLTVGGFAPGYAPTCDGQQMRPGDSCIGTGGGSYDQMVSDHSRDDQIVFFISFPLTILFVVLAVQEWKKGRRGRHE
jgi:hypothetical protein